MISPTTPSSFMTMRCLALIFALAACSSVDRVHAETITTQGLLREMADRDALASFPSPSYRGLQSSSYDRASQKPGTEDWTANRDYSQFLRTDQHQGRTEYVMMEDTGPGAVVRIWITWAGRSGKPFSDGTVRIYLDDAEDAIVTAAASQFIDGGPEGDGGPWAEPDLAYSVAAETPHGRRGHNLFVPIPYATSCRITYETDQDIAAGGRIDESFYYHVGYREYESGTSVETFTLDNWNSIRQLRQDIVGQLNGNVAGDKVPGRKGKTSTGIVEFQGPAAVDMIKVDASNLTPQALRSTLISLTFDGVETVRVPLDGFFTSGYQPANFQTWTHRCHDGVLESRYAMPFNESLVARLISADGKPVDLSLTISTKPWQWTESSMHFHADWRTDQALSTGIAKTQDKRDGVVDLDFLDAGGKGVMVGDSIMLFSGAARWWGEGDEKIFVDGEVFPSHFGTGTEDYYGYAWCRPETFSRPFHAQPVGRGALLGGPVVNTRIRSLDAIPFQSSINFDMELWHWSETRVNYARTVFWYGLPGATSSGSTPALAANDVALEDIDVTTATQRPNAIEGESAKVISVSGGKVEIDRYTLFDWSGGAQLLWKDVRPGDELVLEFEQLPSQSELIYTIGPDYGQVSISSGETKKEINGRFIGIISVLESRRATLPVKPNSKRLTIRMNGKGNEAMRFGLDAIVNGEER